MKRLFTLAAMLVMAGTALTTSALPARASEPEPSTSCNTVGPVTQCVTTPTEICVSDGGSCPFPLPVCWYNGHNPTPVGQLGCHEDEPPEDPDNPHQGVCVEHGDTSIICVGGENDPGEKRWCQWLNIVLDRIGRGCDLF